MSAEQITEIQEEGMSKTETKSTTKPVKKHSTLKAVATGFVIGVIGTFVGLIAIAD